MLSQGHKLVEFKVINKWTSPFCFVWCSMQVLKGSSSPESIFLVLVQLACVLLASLLVCSESCPDDHSMCGELHNTIIWINHYYLSYESSVNSSLLPEWKSSASFVRLVLSRTQVLLWKYTCIAINIYKCQGNALAWLVRARISFYFHVVMVYGPYFLEMCSCFLPLQVLVTHSGTVPMCYTVHFSLI